MSKRAERRHQLNRIKNKVKNYYGGYSSKCTKTIGKLANTRTPCSCYMCCNPRKYGKLTMQEILSNERDRDEYYEEEQDLDNGMS